MSIDYLFYRQNIQQQILTNIISINLMPQLLPTGLRSEITVMLHFFHLSLSVLLSPRKKLSQSSSQ